MSHSSTRIAELRPCSHADPDARHTATVLAAYFNVAQAQAFRRLLWRQTAAAGLIACLIEATTSLLSRSGFFFALALLGAAAAAAAIAQHRAERSLRTLVDPAS